MLTSSFVKPSSTMAMKDILMALVLTLFLTTIYCDVCFLGSFNDILG